MLSNRELIQLIFHPRFSTKRNGLDVFGSVSGLVAVRREIDALRGSIELRSESGRGTCVSIRFPLPMAIIDATFECSREPRGRGSRVTVSRSIQTNHDRSKKYWHNCIRESNGICRWSPAPWDTIGTFLTPRILSTMSRTVTSSAGQTHFARKWCKGNGSALHRSPVSYRNMPTFRLAGRFLLGACIGVPLINRDKRFLVLSVQSIQIPIQ